MKSLDKNCPGQVFANKNQFAFRRVLVVPFFHHIRSHQLLYALEYHFPVGVFHIEHAFVTEHLWAEQGDHPIEKVVELVGIERFFAVEDKGVDVVEVVGTVAIRTANMVVVVMVVVVSVMIQIDFRAEIESAQIEDFGDRNAPEIDGVDSRMGVDPAQTQSQQFDIVGADQIGFRYQQPVGITDLLACLFVFVELPHGEYGIHQGDDTVDHVVLGDIIFQNKGLRDRSGIRQASGFDHDTVETDISVSAFVGQPRQGGDKIAADSAADAAIAHFDDLFDIVLYEDVAVDVFFAEFVFDDGDTLFVLVVPEDSVEQGGFSGAEKAGDDGNGYQ